MEDRHITLNKWGPMAITKINPVYTASVNVTGGRQDGKAVSDDGELDLRLSPPGSKREEPSTNPEQLFAAGYGACYQSALMGAARAAGLDASASTVKADVSLGKEAGGDSFGLAVTLIVTIPGLEQAQVQDLADQAHQDCPYSRATRGNIEVNIIAAS
jgi:Ohr subfamily peroxiredoxin